MNNYTRVQATDLKPGDRVVRFNESTGDQTIVTLKSRKTYEGTGDYWEFYTDGEHRLGYSKGMEAMRCE